MEPHITETHTYKDQWGGKISTGEEMWWSGYWPELDGNAWRGRLRFALDPRHFILNRFLKKALKTTATKFPVVIDFGCGTGGGTINFSRYFGLKWTGYDVFPTQLEIARKQAGQAKNVSEFALLSPDGTLPLKDASVDILFSSDVLGHVPDISRVVKDWGRVLKPDGFIVLYTEAACSSADHSWMARLSREGIDMIASVPEHISLKPREELEAIFETHALNVHARYSGNVFHFFFAPKEFAEILKSAAKHRGLYWAARTWNLLSKCVPFYPKPFYLFKNALTLLLGPRSYGCNYFYLLRPKPMQLSSE